MSNLCLNILCDDVSIVFLTSTPQFLTASFYWITFVMCLSQVGFFIFFNCIFGLCLSQVCRYFHRSKSFFGQLPLWKRLSGSKTLINCFCFMQKLERPMASSFSPLLCESLNNIHLALSRSRFTLPSLDSPCRL